LIFLVTCCDTLYDFRGLNLKLKFSVHSDFLVGVRILSILFVITQREENVNLAYFKIDIEIFRQHNSQDM
jgi:hypothetical protein